MLSLREQHDKCRHFKGIGSDSNGGRLNDRKLEDIDGKPDGRGTCAAGVNYNDVMAYGKRSIALPCFRSEKDNMPANGIWPTCEKCSFKTPAELDAEVAETEAISKQFMERLTIVRPAILKHASWVEIKQTADEEFDGVTPKYPDRKDARGKMPCPICTAGDLHYSIAKYNGHIHARCTTTNCVSWME